MNWSLASSLPNLASKVDAHFVHYKRGEVVLVKFPMPDLSRFKPRPANNQRLKNIILLQITSNISRRDEPTQYFVELNSEEGKNSGLKTDSVVKAEVIFTLPKTYYKLSTEAMKEIEECIKKSLDIE